MKLSKSIATAIVAAGFVMAGSIAHSATFNPGTYDAASATNKDGSEHAVWLVNFMGSDVADRYWDFVDGSSAFVVDEDGATLNGTIVQQTNTKNVMELSMEFTQIDGPGSMGPKCGGSCDDISEWDYFDFVTATATGVGDLAGVILNFEIYPIDSEGRPTMPGQLGMGANDKDAGMGFSTWFSWFEDENSRDFAGRSGRGDVNLQLTESPSEVPLPMPALMLLSGLGALGAARKLRKG